MANEAKQCDQCMSLINTQRIGAHVDLIEENHIFNDTIYKCMVCETMIRLTHVPHYWATLDVTG